MSALPSLDDVIDAARSAASRAHCPYSKFPVGAAALAGDGTIWTGANVENASYPVGCCAEQVALNHAVTHGATLDGFSVVVVYTPTQAPTSPCGACRQVLAELAPSARVVSVCDGSERIDTTVRGLLPSQFDPSLLPSS